MSQPNINTPNSDLVSSLSQSQSYLSPNFLVILPGLTSSVRLCGVERCPAQQSEEEEHYFGGGRIPIARGQKLLSFGHFSRGDPSLWIFSKTKF